MSARASNATKLSDPVTKHEAAAFLGIGLGQVYESLRRFDAARISGDEAAMKLNIPCLHLGGKEQADGTVKGGRYLIPRDAFMRWYVSAGGAALEELYGEAAS